MCGFVWLYVRGQIKNKIPENNDWGVLIVMESQAINLWVILLTVWEEGIIEWTIPVIYNTAIHSVCLCVYSHISEDKVGGKNPSDDPRKALNSPQKQFMNYFVKSEVNEK